MGYMHVSSHTSVFLRATTEKCSIAPRIQMVRAQHVCHLVVKDDRHR